MEQVLPQGEAISCQTLPRLGPAHTKRLRKLWSYGRPVHVAQLEGVDFDLQVHGFLETMDSGYNAAAVLTLTKMGLAHLNEARQKLIAAQRPHHELGQRLAAYLRAKGLHTWENVEFSNPHWAQPRSWSVVRPDVFACLTPAQREEFLLTAFSEIAKGMGIDRFMQTPAERMEQFAVMSVTKNHDTAGLLRSLVNSFMIAYACPETSARAFAALTQIEGLRAEVADKKGQGKMTPHPMLAHAARTLQERVNAATGAKEGADLWATVMVGADRLYVKPKAGYQLKGLPEVFMGFPVERIAELAS